MIYNDKKELPTEEKERINSLIKAAKEGNDEAIAVLIERYRNYVFKLVKSIYINGYETCDLVQLGYMSILKAIRSYDAGRGNFTNYVTFAIKKNFYYAIRKETKNGITTSLSEAVADGMNLEDVIGTDTSSEDRYMDELLHQYLADEVDKLPENLKDIITYVYLEDRGNVKAYAASKGLNYYTAVKRRKRALELLYNDMRSNL